MLNFIFDEVIIERQTEEYGGIFAGKIVFISSVPLSESQISGNAIPCR
jgi:hypothetical protein